MYIAILHQGRMSNTCRMVDVMGIAIYSRQCKNQYMVKTLDLFYDKGDD